MSEELKITPTNCPGQHFRAEVRTFLTPRGLTTIKSLRLLRKASCLDPDCSNCSEVRRRLTLGRGLTINNLDSITHGASYRLKVTS